ncbi:MAG: ABC transporter permease [Cytophagales bacterium]|nr:ABC transporter permease [Cytophagales bacterium]
MTGKLLHIIRREFVVRVRKRSFIITTLSGPFLIALTMIVPIWVAMLTSGEKTIMIVNDNPQLDIQSYFTDSEHYKYIFINTDVESAKKAYYETQYAALLHLPLLNISVPQGIALYSKGSISIDTKMLMEHICNKIIENERLNRANIDPKILDNIRSNVKIHTINMAGNSEKINNTSTMVAVSLFGSVLIYMFIFIYGTYVLRGVIEEKTSRIVEILITSVTPIQLMMGKIIGICMVALVQFTCWISFSGIITMYISSHYRLERYTEENIAQTIAQSHNVANTLELYEIISTIQDINFTNYIIIFIFYFLCGYLLYGAIFAAIGAMVDSETDTQQFIFPVTIPLILSFVFVSAVMKDPGSDLSVILSIFPFTSPIIMMVRYPFGVESWQLACSAVVIMVTFVIFTYISAKIYRTTLLLYGQKPTYRQIWKWLWY